MGIYIYMYLNLCVNMCQVLKFVNSRIINNPEEIKKGVRDNRITVSYGEQ